MDRLLSRLGEITYTATERKKFCCLKGKATDIRGSPKRNRHQANRSASHSRRYRGLDSSSGSIDMVV